MTITDTEIYQMEEIIDAMEELLSDANAIVSGCDDYIIENCAKDNWIKIIRDNLRSERNIPTMADTIDDLWEDYHTNTSEENE